MNKFFDYTQKFFVFVAKGPIFAYAGHSDEGDLTIEKRYSRQILVTSIAIVASAIFTAYAASKVTFGTSLAIFSAVAIVSGPTTMIAAAILAAKWGITVIVQAVALKHIAIGLGSLALGLGLWGLNPLSITLPSYKGGLLGNYIDNTL